MHTELKPDNPHGYTRWGFAWEYIEGNGRSHLDFGCHDGDFLDTLRHKNMGRLVGVDVCREAIEQGRQRFKQLELTRISQVDGLPFADATFDSASALDVLEHVFEQKELLRELNRVLKDAGTLIITVPGKHLFSFLDLGNLKFLFPRLHRWFYTLTHSRAEYESRYVSNPDGLIGDVSARKRWHEHFSRAALRRLVEEAGFDVIEFDAAGFFFRPIFCTCCALGWIRPLRRALERLEKIDAARFEATHLFCAARKRTIDKGAPK